MKERKAQYSRKTEETNISVSLFLDGEGKNKIDTPIGFLNHKEIWHILLTYG